jgi:aldose 1-epimerase
MSVRPMGRLGAVDILEVELRSEAGAVAKVMTWGAVLRDFVVPGPNGPQRVVLGLDRLEDYLAHSPYFGAVVGRYANRIGDARYRLGGQDVHLAANEAGNELHGGPAGFGLRPWSLLASTPASATLALVSPDGDQGYPGRVLATCTYELREPATLRITLEATTDQPSPVNLSTHSYWNLDGSSDIRHHRLAVEADFYTPVDSELIPTGAIVPVAGTVYDFRSAREIRAVEPYPDYDINYVVRRERSVDPELVRAATLASDRSGLAMELWTTEPGLQLYDGHKIDIPVPGLDGMRYGPYAGMPLEPQRFPDGPNHAHFPPCILQPGQVSRQVSEMRFRAA